MYPPQQPPLQMQMKPQRQFGTLDFLTGIIYVLCGVAIIIGFFELPFITIGRDSTRNLSNIAQLDSLSASRLTAQLTSSNVTDLVYASLSDSNAFATLLPVYAIYGFLSFAGLFFLGALSSIFRAIFRGNQRIGFFSGFFRIIITPIIYIGIPLVILGAFYTFVVGPYEVTDLMNSRGQRFSLDTIRNVTIDIPPGTGMLLMFGACVLGAIMTIIATIGGIFKRTTPQMVMVQQPYGAPAQYPPQYGQSSVMGVYSQPQPPPTQPPHQYPPEQASQNPIDWGKK